MNLRQAHAIITTGDQLTALAPDLGIVLWPHDSDHPTSTPGLPDHISGHLEIPDATGATSRCYYGLTISPGPTTTEITVFLNAASDSDLDNGVLVNLTATVHDPGEEAGAPFRPVGADLAQTVIDTIREREARRPR
ncbi:hypothetical protein [Kitasatospora sp. A2-31]|uniref:hypothetical protein n=1 Tax=Kitasatospora sp. A2-31 TaxID=2916414 RepID=UPI001EED3D10|nr:hypothetical protein [Kitasatospora sp. A2-31]MCG6499218.1 hypothetical protein [Kitasatospora sp. A2-31]